MKRGLHQGCPLSPFLFIIIVEALSCMIKKVEVSGKCKGVQIAKRGFRISHLQFADDTLLFCNNELDELLGPKRILKCFQSVSGLKINYQKSQLLGIGIKEHMVEKWTRVINCKVGNVWKWDIPLRRTLFYWERSQWYTTKSFCKMVLNTNSEESKIWKEVWSGVAPHRIEAFVWQLLFEKVGVKVELADKGMLKDIYDLCVFCEHEKETCNHLFIRCAESWKIWGMWCKLFNIKWVALETVKSFFVSWNDCVIGKKKWDEYQCWELVKFRITSWANSKWPMDYGSISDVFFDPSVGCLGLASIDGIMRNESGDVKIVFSKPIGKVDSSQAEIMAVNEAIFIFATSKWKGSHMLIIESDASNVMYWVKN
ncbi:Uncharacterized protein TCM_009396 [Theobroma cacao]|uniref:Reverse transcriptase domain-containing protein n=1 Tax=Theobroma cacao TaxID=3641 RepID=A0A061E4S8_THECC|nr:Uncharacterized protein TCM_009396 [Theobroma cacao]